MDLSVIIPTYNRAEVLRVTLERFLDLETVGLAWELIVVDNNSSDSTETIVKDYASRLPLKYLFEPAQGKNRALNSALRQARGDLFVFADDDISPDSNWLNKIVRASERWPEHDVFGGRILPLFPQGTPQYVRESDYSDYVFAIHDLQQPEGPYRDDDATPNGPNCWLRRRLFESGWQYEDSIGPCGKGRVSGSELELFTRLKATGHHPIYVPSARVLHRIQRYQTSLGYLLRRSFASGRGLVRIFGFPNSVVRIFGAPRYLYRLFLGHAALACAQLLVWRFKQAFEALMHCSTVLGSIHEARAAQGAPAKE